MKIHELSRLTHVNVETIRMYRNKGLLTPRQGENGYYEYSEDDLQNLLSIRKFRGMDVSLSTIAYTYTHADVDGIVEGLRQEYDQLEARIAAMRRRQFMLKVTVDHYDSYRSNRESVMELEIPHDRYDMIYTCRKAYPDVDLWLDNFELFTQGVRIPEAYLQGEALPERVPVQLTLGTYQPILTEHGVPIPPGAICVPRGRYLAVIAVCRGSRIEREPLQRLLDYARERGLRPTGESTAFLFRIERTPEGLQFYYRLRIRVENEE